MADSSKEKELSEPRRMTAQLSELEADLAYCDARITLIGNDPDTPYQKAQLTAFKILEKQLKYSLLKQKQLMDLLRKE